MTEWFDSDPYFILTIHKLINQGVKTSNDRYCNTHQKSILSNTFTESDIYNNYSYSYASCVNWEIEKTSETPSKKLEFNIDNPETGLKKTDFNTITNNDEIDDMNDNISDHSSDDSKGDMYNSIDHNNVDQKQTNHNSLYTLADNKLKLSSALENLGWNTTDSQEGELIITYNSNVGNKTLRQKAFYVLYVKLNEEGNRHLIYRLATDQIVVTKNYQTVPVPENLVDTICETDPYENKSQVNDVDTIYSKVYDDQSNNYDNNDHTHFDNEDQYLQGAVRTTLSLQASLLVFIHENILHHLHKDIFTVVHVLLSILMNL